jgi:hypothetical protein
MRPYALLQCTDQARRVPCDYYSRPNRSSTSQRYSTATVSSDASSLHRTSSTTSNGSTSRWSTSSASSVETTSRSKHRKSSSTGSFRLPRALQPFHKKALAQLQTHELKIPPTSTTSSPRSPLTTQPPPRPPRPEERLQVVSEPSVAVDSIGHPSSQWQFSDLVVRCRDEVYHVDRTIMCYHSRWFARICAIIKKPVCIICCMSSRILIDISKRQRA